LTFTTARLNERCLIAAELQAIHTGLSFGWRHRPSCSTALAYCAQRWRGVKHSPINTGKVAGLTSVNKSVRLELFNKVGHFRATDVTVYLDFLFP
jgi:hypothetical protein